MQQMYQVFIYQSSITFQHPTDLKNQKKDRIYVQTAQVAEVIKIIDWLRIQDFKVHIIFMVDDLDTFWQKFQDQFTIVKAAGGIVENGNAETLFIFRNGKWDLPKGKVEKNEEVEKAAIREVEEECGIQDLKIINKLPTTYHIYWQDEIRILKPTFWYKMYSGFEGQLIPQTEEGIEKVEWLKKDDYEKVYDNTFASIEALIKAI